MEIPFELIQNYRSRTFRIPSELRLTTKEQAVAYVNERGFVFLWPINGYVLPSLWTAVAGDRPVADEHDDPGHVTWGWKDASLGGRDWYYSKSLRKKSTFISFDLAPHFYALSENYGSFEDDYLTLYEQGRMTVEAKQIYEALLETGRMDTVELRKATHMTSPGSDGRFNKAITDLQADFKITPVAVTQSGAWRYAFAYDITARYYPELPVRAQAISENEAQRTLAEWYLKSLGACQARDLARLFGWRPRAVERAEAALVQAGVARSVTMDGRSGNWIALAELFDA